MGPNKHTVVISSETRGGGYYMGSCKVSCCFEVRNLISEKSWITWTEIFSVIAREPAKTNSPGYLFYK